MSSPSTAGSSRTHVFTGTLAFVRARPAILLALGEMLVVALVLFVAIGGRSRDFHVPLAFTGDASEYLMQSKATIEDGWWWTHTRLSAPSVFRQVSYPSNTNVEQAVVWIVGRFTRDVGLAINISWFLLLGVGGALASAALRRLGLGTGFSSTLGILFALSPYALLSGVDHFCLTPYLTPIACFAALAVASGHAGHLSRRQRVLLVIGCALIGFDYVYYAFFTVFLLLVAVGIAAAQRRATWRIGVVLACGVCVSTAVNFIPSYVGREPLYYSAPAQEKMPAEADVYGLKVRHLLGPVPGYATGPLAYWKHLEEAAAYPIENENSVGRLGLVGSAGLLLLFAGLVGGFRRAGVLGQSAAGLVLGLILLSTVGGLGTIFNLLALPDIRAYNRVYPFIQFFALFVLGAALERQLSGAERRHRVMRTVAAGAIFLVGTFDQLHAAKLMNDVYERDRSELADVRSFVQRLEAAVPAGSLVFQLPVASFPADDSRGRARTYDSAKPYLFSHSLRWSFPAFGDALNSWQRKVGALALPDLAAAVRLEGFSLLVIDRAAYDDNGAGLLAGLPHGGASALILESRRYVALDIQRLSGSRLDPEHLPRLKTRLEPATKGLDVCAGPAQYSLDVIGARHGPFGKGVIEAPWRGDVDVLGWAVDPETGTPAADVDIAVGDVLIPTIYGIARTDVAAALRMPSYRDTGFMTRIPRAGVGRGLQRVAIRAVAAGGRCYFQGPWLTIDFG